jgi:hypothetical protein
MECYECSGDGACTICGGDRFVDGAICTNCTGTGRCILCRGEGQIPNEKIRLEYVGAFRELELDDDPDALAMAEVRGKRPPENKAEVVRYLSTGKPMVVSPGGAAIDVFDPTRKTTTRSILTDGRFAWSKQLAYYVSTYDVLLPAHFERHMASQRYQIGEVNTSKLVLP